MPRLSLLSRSLLNGVLTSPVTSSEQSLALFKPRGWQRLRFIAAVGFVTTGVGCSNLDGPDYERPQVAEKAAWSLNEGTQTDGADALVRLDWWAEFSDPDLDQLVAQGIAGNLDVRILAARIDAAGVGLQQQQLSGRPSLSLGLGADATRSAESGSAQNFTSSLTGLSWEIDIWGKARRGVEAQQAQYRASEADYRAGYLTLAAQVATHYFEVRQFDRQIRQQQASERQGTRILAIFRAQAREGIIASTKVIKQQAEVRSLTKTLLDLRRQRAIAENRINALLGLAPGSIAIAPRVSELTIHPPVIPIGLPADLLSRRPDVLAAEYRVLQAYNLVGQARLAKLPSIKLTGSGGLTSAVLKGLLSSWSLGLGAAVNIPIFDPSLDLKIEQSTIQHRIAEDSYRKVVIQAFEEVENALLNLASRKQQREVLGERVRELDLVRGAVNAQLREGIVSQLEVFESERSTLTARQSLLDLDHQILRDSVTLYKALGGGWPVETVQSDNL